MQRFNHQLKAEAGPSNVSLAVVFGGIVVVANIASALATLAMAH